MTAIGIIRKWLQWNASNGDTVIWGSNEVMHFNRSLKASDFEELGKMIDDAFSKKNK